MPSFSPVASQVVGPCSDPEFFPSSRHLVQGIAMMGFFEDPDPEKRIDINKPGSSGQGKLPGP